MTQTIKNITDAQYQCWYERNPTAWDAIMIPTATVNSPVLLRDLTGKGSMKRLCQYWLNCFDNMSVVINEVCEDKHKNICMLSSTLSGQQGKSFMGAAAIGGNYDFECIDIYRFHKGKLISYQSHINLLKAFMRHLMPVDISRVNGQREENCLLLDISNMSLTTEEKEHISLMSLGLGDKEIAFVFDKHTSSIKTCRTRIFKKLNITSKSQLLYLLMHNMVFNSYINYAIAFIKTNKPVYFKAHIKPMCCS